ncbi:YrhB domain-containing protein [Streptomyces sp. NPDC015171]|uniref:YrhB domain-containing protein n=1 Tax=Streptomyces sp. NPDC015171 TaxID=3364945 RepID=UPI0036F4B826
MIEREAVVRAVEDQLERDYQQWRPVSADAVRMAVIRIEEHELVWIVSWQSEEFVRTRNSKYALTGGAAVFRTCATPVTGSRAAQACDEVAAGPRPARGW